MTELPSQVLTTQSFKPAYQRKRILLGLLREQELSQLSKMRLFEILNTGRKTSYTSCMHINKR